MAVVQDFEQVAPFAWGEDGEAPVVEDEQIEAGDGLDLAGMAAVAARERQRLEQARHAMVGAGAAIPTGLLAEGTGDPTLSEASRAGDQQVLVTGDPAAVDEMGDDGTVDAARAAQVDVLDAGFELISQRYERGATLITSNLPFDEWTETFGSGRLTGALLDRLTHHVHILEMNGNSFRLGQSRAAKDAPIN